MEVLIPSLLAIAVAIYSISKKINNVLVDDSVAGDVSSEYDTVNYQDNVKAVDESISLNDIEDIHELANIEVNTPQDSKNSDKSNLLDDFDPVKAIVYSEIMKPKYLD